MGWFNLHVIGSIAPRWAFTRERYSRALKAYYEAVEPSRLRKNRVDASGNVVNDRGAVKTRTLARHLDENLDIASGILDVLVSNTVGSGIMSEPLVETKSGEPAEDFNLKLSRLHDDWIHECEVTRQFDKATLERLVARSWCRDGEGFGQKLIGTVPGLQHGTVLPYSLQAFEADFVPFDLNDPGKGIRQGIECDRWGRPRKYYTYKQHPADTLFGGVADLVAVDAERVMHLKMVKRLHQLRGASVFTSALARLDDIKEIDESERVAARVAAAMAGFIKKGNPDFYTAPQMNPDGTRKLREMEMVPGIIFDDLLPGEDIGSITSTRPNNALIPFRDAQLRAASSGSMVSYSSASKNYNGTYSAQRQELVEQFVTYRALSCQFIFRWSQPTWDGFIDAVLASGAADVTADIDRDTLYNVSHMAPPMPWIDPEAEVQAAILAEQHLYESKSSIIRRRGGNPNQTYREIQRDRRQIEERGLQDAAPASDAGGDPQQQANATARAVVRFMRRRSE